MQQQQDEKLTVAQATRVVNRMRPRAHLHYKGLWLAVANGELPSYGARRPLVLLSDVIAWIDEQMDAAHV